MIIYKYSLQRTSDIQPVFLPVNAKYLDWGFQHGIPVMWFLVDSEVSIERYFKIIGTGWECKEIERGTYLGTKFENEFVWHLFEVSKEDY
jgi:hypothetical protein